jgi:hypothetical protein
LTVLSKVNTKKDPNKVKKMASLANQFFYFGVSRIKSVLKELKMVSITRVLVTLACIIMGYIGYQMGEGESVQRWASLLGVLPLIVYTVWYLFRSPDIYGEKKTKKADEKKSSKRT